VRLPVARQGGGVRAAAVVEVGGGPWRLSWGCDNRRAMEV